MPFTHEQIKVFIQALAVDPGRLGLVVSAGDPGLVVLPAPADRAEIIALSRETDPESVTERMFACAKEQRWCRIHLLDGALPGRVYNQLRNIATMGRVQVIGRGESNVEEFTWPETAKLVVVISSAVESMIVIPTFLNLFGPVLHES